jgi:hypothetical protein
VAPPLTLREKVEKTRLGVLNLQRLNTTLQRAELYIFYREKRVRFTYNRLAKVTKNKQHRTTPIKLIINISTNSNRKVRILKTTQNKQLLK